MAKPEKDPLVGTRVREYEILELIGRGGMGAVYRARHVYLDEERAIKVIQARLTSDQEFVDRFIREAKILTRLNNPHVVQLYEFGTLDEEGTFFMVLEFIRGESLLQRVRKMGRIPVEDAVRIIREAAQGLSSAHQKGIVHRDISPDNLLLVRDDSGREITKVIDFGIAKPLLEGSRHHTMTNMFIGKPEYCSPEQCGLLEEGEEIDRRADIYSLGITFYYTLAGKLPFYAVTPQAYLVKHLNEAPKPLTAHLSSAECPPGLNDVLMKMLAKKRDDRYASLEDFVADLERIELPDETRTEAVSGVSVAPPPVQQMRPGEVFAKRYRIQRKLGEGGMGAVYKATDTILNIPVALKIMSPRIIHDEGTLERFKREVILARKVAHPNACRVFDIGDHAGIHYVSMEYLDGLPLSELLRTHGRLPPERCISIIKQVLKALEEAHRVGVVHRDLKPANIMVLKDDHSSIMDFGISISSDVHRVTRTGQIVGTPHYMAPEQFESASIDRRADLYAVGVMMYQMLTGRLPFEGHSPIAVIYAHLKSTPQRPSEITPDLPEEIERIILRAMEKDAEKRFQSAAEFLKALEAQHETISALTFKREALVHKLLAERNYSKAIKLIKTLLESNPENEDWKKLLQFAVSERIRRNLRKVKFLIQKNDLVAAKALLDRIGREHPSNSRVMSQVKKLEAQINEQRDQVIDACVSESRRLLAEANVEAALASIEAAAVLNPEDARVTAVREEIQTARTEIRMRELREEVLEARRLLEAGDLDGAQSICQSALEKEPAFEPVESLVRDIQAARREAHLQALRARVEEARILLGRGQFDEARGICAEILLKEPSFQIAVGLRDEIDAARRKAYLDSLQARVNQARALAGRGHYDEALGICAEVLLKEPSFQLALVLRGEIDAARKKAYLDSLQTRVDQARTVMEHGQFDEALSICADVLRKEPSFQPAAKLRGEVQAARQKAHSDSLQTRVAQARALAGRGQLDEALSICADVLLKEPSFQPAVQLHGEIQAARHKAHADVVQARTEEARMLAARGRHDEALSVCEEILEKNPSFQPAAILRGQIQGARRVHALDERIRQEMGKILQLVSAGQFDQAEAALDAVLPFIDADEVRSEFLHLQPDLHSVIRACAEKDDARVLSAIPALPDQRGWLAPHQWILSRLVEEATGRQLERQRIAECMQKGKGLFERLQWEEAIRAWEEALAVSPELPDVRELIRETQEKLAAELQIRQRITVGIAEAQKRLDAKQYGEALEVVAKVQEQLAPGYRLGDLKRAIDALRQKAQDALQAEKTRKEQITRDLADARAHYGAGRLEPARQKLETLLASEPAHADARDLLGKVHAALRERELAQAVSERVARVAQLLADEKGPDLEKALQELQAFTGQTRHRDEAAAIITSVRDVLALQRDGSPGAAAARVRRLSSESALLAPSADGLEKLAVKLDQRQKDIEFQKIMGDGRAKLEALRWEEAIDVFKTAGKLRPGDATARKLLSQAEKGWRDLKAAHDKLASIRQKIDRKADARSWKEAIELCTKALAEFERVPGVEAEIAGVCSRLEQAKEARAVELREAEAAKAAAAVPAPAKAPPPPPVVEKREAPAAVPAPKAPRAAPVPRPAVPERAATRRWMYIAAAAMVVTALITTVVVIRSRSTPEPVATPGPTAAAPTVPGPAPTTPAPIPAPASATVSLNALPWARIKLSPVTKGIAAPTVPEEESVTPCFLTLPAGEYNVELRNDISPQPLTQKIRVEANRENSYVFTMPRYEPKAIAQQMASKRQP